MSSAAAADFFEPRRKPELSQWFTPPPIARKLATWVSPTARVLEPACGSGNLIGALIRQGHGPERITAVEIDPEWALFTEQRFYGAVKVLSDGFFDVRFDSAFDVVLMNPPFEAGQATDFIDVALKHAPMVIGIFPVTVQFGEERDRTFWSQRAKVVRRALLPERVDYGGDWSASFETVALKIVARDMARLPGEILQISEEVWRKERMG